MCYTGNMMMVSGITLYHEQPPAVALSPMLFPQTTRTATVATGTQRISGEAAMQWQQHPNPFDRSRQDAYDLHGKVVHRWQPIGTRLDRLI
ncbi:MAG: hypothetical protein AUJ57_01750 [Zetaproteobacteria bacterium CG1_02_53_45]|nr:MAG: hypothetical protein AUJ57_01750 [Zetaproteobacteria bacterium CG1_02_53_45]